MQPWKREARSQTDLAEALGIDHSTVTKMLQRLQAAGHIKSRYGVSDSRNRRREEERQ